MRLGSLLIVIGTGVVLVGALIRFAPGLLAWFGHLPGDIRINGDNTRVFIPITSMIVVSVVLTLVVNAVAWVVRNR